MRPKHDPTANYPKNAGIVAVCNRGRRIANHAKRRRRDSNPRYLSVNLFSRQAPSTTRPLLRILGCFFGERIRLLQSRSAVFDPKTHRPSNCNRRWLRLSNALAPDLFRNWRHGAAFAGSPARHLSELGHRTGIRSGILPRYLMDSGQNDAGVARLGSPRFRE
jgi:hypothetical protein